MQQNADNSNPYRTKEIVQEYKEIIDESSREKQVIEGLSYHDSNAFSNNNIIMYGVIKYIDSQ